MNIDSIPAIQRYNITLYNKSNAYRVLEELRVNKIELYGLDGFFMRENNGIQPEQDYSLDFGRDPYNFTDYRIDKVYTLTKEVIDRAPDNVYFEFSYPK